MSEPRTELTSQSLREFLPYTEPELDFLLLAAECSTGYPRDLAELAARPAWLSAVESGLAGIGRGALRAARLLGALAAHPDVARSLDPAVGREVTRSLVRALAHSRFAVWSRAARAMGRLAGGLSDVPAEITKLFEPATPATLRRRAHTALSTLASDAPGELLAKRVSVTLGQVEPWLPAMLALGLPDLVLESRGAWPEMVRTFAARGGPETWATLVLALREIATRYPREGPLTQELGQQLRKLADAHKPVAAADIEMLERTLALVARVSAGAEVSPWLMTQRLCELLAADPASHAALEAADELVACTDAGVSSAIRAVSQGDVRTSARAATLLEEIVDLVVDGDLAIVAERIANGQKREALSSYVDGLHKKLLKTTWTGLLRPTPATPLWRRWLLRAASVLPRVEPIGPSRGEREKIVRDQTIETLARIADDPSLQQPTLQRNVLTAIVDLAEVLRREMPDDARLAVLAWVAVRSGTLPVHARTRRVLDEVPAEQVDRLFALVVQLGQARTGAEGDLAELAQLAGTRTRIGNVLARLSREITSIDTTRPETHWSGLPKLDLSAIAQVADELKRAREEAAYALASESVAEQATAPGLLVTRAAALSRTLTSTSLKFMDATRRVEVSDGYVSDLTAFCEAIASACGPVAGTVVRAQLAKALVAVRAQANAVAKDRDGSARYIGRLRVLGALSADRQGGMASTYLAEGPAPGKRVVVKLLPWEKFAGANAASARLLFEREMQRLAPIVHPNVVSIIDAGFVDEGAYIALEHIPGASLEAVLRVTKRLEPLHLAPIVRDAARALSHLHARGIVHRDIKPGNVMIQLDALHRGALTRESWEEAQYIRAVVIDLGIATDPAEARSDTSDIVGTPGYLAPEVARGLDLITGAIDVYALGVVAFEALTGINPFLDGSPELPALLVRHGTMELPFDELPQEARRPGLVPLLADATSLDPKTRPSMDQFLARWTVALG